MGITQIIVVDYAVTNTSGCFFSNFWPMESSQAADAEWQFRLRLWKRLKCESIECCKAIHAHVIRSVKQIVRRYDMRQMPRWSALRWRSIT